MRRIAFKILLLGILSVLFSIKTFASHAAGMDISYECITQGNSSDTYKVTLKFYRDCEGIPAPSSHPLNYSSSCGSNSATLYQVGSAVDINPNCTSYCNGGNGFGVEQYTYEATITLAHCSNWVLSVCESSRNGSISTINSPGIQDLCVQATINNTTYCNNSPTFSQYPTPFICVGGFYCYNNGAIEVDGDSLVYSLITPLNSSTGGTVSYLAPYSATNPVGGGSSFDPITGNLCVTPPSIISGVLAIKVSEYRNGILIGSIIRDIQINVFNCGAITPPTLSGIDTSTVVNINNVNTYTVELCPSGLQNINFDINTINPPPPPPPPSANITVTISTQSWGNEISWDITSFGTIVASGGSYASYNSYTTTVCVPIGSLVFNMYDSYGDGWNGGTYTITGNPTLSGTTSGGLTGSTSIGSNNFSISGGTPCVPPVNAGAIVNMTWNNGIPSASFTITNNNTLNPTGTFNWTPTLADTAGSPYYFTVNVTNDACPAPGNFSFQYQIILNSFTDIISPTITDVSCNGVNDGYINLSVTGTQGPYSYLWDTGDSLQSINNLAGGTYNVMVTDSFGCSDIKSFTVNEPAAFTASVSSTNISCFGANDGKGSVNTFGVSATYLWNNLATTDSIYNLSAGNYSVDITDGNGCTLTDYITITEPLAISTSTSTSDISCNGLTDGNISLTINGGIPDYTINVPPFNQVLIGGVNTFITPSLLGAGTYNYSITDSNGCVFNSSATLIEPASISVTKNQTNVSCNGGNDGLTSLVISGGTPIFTQDWGLNNPLALSAGTANFQITDNNGCTYTDSVIITEPNLLTATYTQTNVSTCLASDGSIDATISGGTTPYYYNWNNGSTTEDLSNIPGGIYLLTVTDDKGCTAILSVTITEPPSPTLSFTQTNVSCNGGNDGSIDLTVNGGTSPFTYIWTNNEISQDINNLASGNYSVQVSDDNSCSQNITITITEPSAPSISATQVNVDCNGNNTGSIDLTVVGSSSFFTFSWSNGQSTEDIINLLAGNYSYTITDANNCTYTNLLTISEPNALAVNPLTVNVNCKGENNGYIILNTSGGTVPYFEDFGTANPAALTAGNYPFTITDNNGCLYSSSINISEPDSLLVSASSTNATCGGYFDGTATLIITGGTLPYNSNWGLSNPTALNAGTHNYIVTDTNNCFSQGSVTITEPIPMQIIVDTFRVSCFGLSDGSATLTISAGAGSPYNQDWGTVNPNGLSAGIHTFTITDVNNCTAQGQAIITQPADILVNEILNHVSCFGQNDGTAFLQINGGISPYIENWNSINILSLSAGSYSYSVTDANNCIKNNFITINEPDTLRATATVIDANCFNSNDGKIYLNITGGTAPYNEYFGTFNPFALAEGNYSFTVTDVNGCIFDSSAIVNQANEVSLSFLAESPICRNDSTELSIIINNPKSNIYTVVINDSVSMPYVIDSLGLLIPEGIKPKLFPNFTTNIVIETITDKDGCSSSVNDTAHVIVNQLPVLDITLTDICVGSPSFTLNQGTPTGGDYAIDGENTNFFDVESLENGPYTIKYNYTDFITNCNNSIEKIININPSPVADFSFSPQPTNIDEPNILFINKSIDIENTKWNLGDGTILANELNFWHTYADTGKYDIIYVVNNEFNCVDSLTATLIINPAYQIFIPNSFTPNNDGDNDVFQPFVNGANNYTMTIFNRWGEIIYNEENGFWDGKVNDNLVQNGIYSYSILVYDFKDKPFIYTGIITLLQ
jgi:gliding motility-associated-like protein